VTGSSSQGSPCSPQANSDPANGTTLTFTGDSRAMPRASRSPAKAVPKVRNNARPAASSAVHLALRTKRLAKWTRPSPPKRSAVTMPSPSSQCR